jgi:morphogenetic protein associated with SpoVID
MPGYATYGGGMYPVATALGAMPRWPQVQAPQSGQSGLSSQSGQSGQSGQRTPAMGMKFYGGYQGGQPTGMMPYGANPYGVTPYGYQPMMMHQVGYTPYGYGTSPYQAQQPGTGIWQVQGMAPNLFPSMGAPITPMPTPAPAPGVGGPVGPNWGGSPMMVPGTMPFGSAGPYNGMMPPPAMGFGGPPGQQGMPIMPATPRMPIMPYMPPPPGQPMPSIQNFPWYGPMAYYNPYPGIQLPQVPQVPQRANPGPLSFSLPRMDMLPPTPGMGGASFPTHPFVRSPRDFFMWGDNMADERAKGNRPNPVP